MRCVQRRHPRMCGCAAVAVHSLAVQSEGAPHSAQREASAEGRFTVCVRSAAGLRVSLARRTSLYFCRELVLIPHRERSAAATPPPVLCAPPPPHPQQRSGRGRHFDGTVCKRKDRSRGTRVEHPTNACFQSRVACGATPTFARLPKRGCPLPAVLGSWTPPHPSPDTLPRPPVTPSSHEPSRAVGRGESCAERCVTQRFAGQ